MPNAGLPGAERLRAAREELLKDLQLIETVTRLATASGEYAIHGASEEVRSKTMALARIDAEEYLWALEEFRNKNGLR